MTLEEEVVLLRAENLWLKRQLAQALGRIAELEKGQHSPPPPFVKANRPKREEPKKSRRKRAAEHNHSRRREEPTQTVEHVLERCPECNYRLSGTSLDYSRQVIELPPPQPVEVIEHRVIKRYCPSCESWRSPKLDLKGQVIGQGRMGVVLASLIAYLRQTLRLPIRRIQDYLKTIHQLTISSGEIVELLHHVRRASVEVVKGLKGEVRASAVKHGDETGWRENGRNGYIWCFATPGEQGVRYYEYDHSRGQGVVKRILGERGYGHLVSDFYAGYNDYAGKQQRCWVHLLRDLHEVKEAHPQEGEVVEWAKAVRQLHDEGQEWLEKGTDPPDWGASGNPPEEQREMKYVSLMEEAHQLGLRYAQRKGHPCQALAKRIVRHEDELFQFVVVPGLSADNNLVERSIRPMVVVRKISGGTRSTEGTKTRMALANLPQIKPYSAT